MEIIKKELLEALNLLNGVKTIKGNIHYPLQQIFYGAPGTGKSFKIDKDTKGYEVVRTTFHPDSDYSTFVGAYKPVMEYVEKQVVPVVFNNSTFGFDTNNGNFKERCIAYKFVKQAFLKAYLGAWKKYAVNGPSQRSGLVLTATNGEKFILTEVGTDYVGYTKESRINIGQFEKEVRDYWNNNVIQNKKDNWKWYQNIVSLWYQEREEEEQSADRCWDAFKEELSEKNNAFSYSTTSQTYLMVKDGQDIVISMCKVKRAWIKAIADEYEEQSQGSSSQATIARKLKEYGGKFKDAWEKLRKDVKASQSSSTNTSDSNAVLPQFLIIEEINRGNCAQIFGDLFQLLDRSDNGFSTYPIEVDTDMQTEIARSFKEDEEYKLSSKINIEGAVKGYTSNYGATLSEDVQEGRILLLPPNLYIWATMNTSDQSLFPIDSAFKRRWDWKYIKIAEGKEKENEKPLLWKILVEDEEQDRVRLYDWWKFLQLINIKIFGATQSADKQMGYFFAKAKEQFNGNKIGVIKKEVGFTSLPSESISFDYISAETFVNKVLFYLWTDVLKDNEYEEIASLMRDSDKSLTFPDFFDETGMEINPIAVRLFLNNVMKDEEEWCEIAEWIIEKQKSSNGSQSLFPAYELFKPNSVIFKITEKNLTSNDLYNRVRGWWKMAKERANIDKTKYAYAYSTPERKIVACYKVSEWKSLDENGKIKYGFEGKEENNDPMIGKPVESIAHVRGQVVFYPKEEK